ncbi:MAG: MmpS family transport accessory protein [Spirochaetes bacterium]|nr:MmpS family transport accessory protein [Spirochaetota bacterium]
MGKKLVIISVFCLFLSSCDFLASVFLDSVEKIIGYKVTGTASSVTISYTNSNGNQVTRNNVTLPWETTFPGTIMEHGTFWASISATNEGSIVNNVTVRIYVDGEVLRSNSENFTASASVGVRYDD